MSCSAIVVAGLNIPCDSWLFLTVLAVHITFGLACVVTGLIAMLSKKRPGRHLTFGTLYYRCLAVVVVTAGILSAMRWAEDYYLFILGALSFTAATLGRSAHQKRWRGWVRLHILGMSLSYIFLLTAFYVDNGKSLPVWQDLPPPTYWLLPSAIGLPLIVWALWRHPLVRRANKPTQDAPD